MDGLIVLEVLGVFSSLLGAYLVATRKSEIAGFTLFLTGAILFFVLFNLTEQYYLVLLEICYGVLNIVAIKNRLDLGLKLWQN